MAGGQTSKTVRYNGHVFERIRVLGKGAFGTAVLHKRQHDSALVVLKEIDLVELRREADKLAAIQEARIMSKLSHANIIKYQNAYTNESKLIIEMEYARLGTLQTYLAYQSRALEEREIFHIFRQVLFGLDYLHSKSIVHLDLKMANIFVTSDGGIKIGDFGIAKFVRSAGPPAGRLGQRQAEQRAPAPQRADQYQLGTLAYSSPERCLGEPTDSKSDIWSLGCVLYELTTRRALFASESLPELVLSIIRVQFEPIQRTDIRPAIKRLFGRMIARQPADRPSAAELISDTDQLLLQLEPARSPGRPAWRAAGPAEPSQRRAKQTAGDTPAEAGPGPDAHPINYKHSLLYQVRLGAHDLQVDRVNLPQSKRIKEIARGRAHYLVLTYDDIVYGWGAKQHGQLGACSALRAGDQYQRQHRPHRPAGSPAPAGAQQRRFTTRSARNSLTARDLQLLAPKFAAGRHTAAAANSLSLSSSTQTILAANSRPAANHHSGSAASLMADEQSQRASAQRRQFRLLQEAPPAVRPVVINELNKRKISRIAAGNNFSVFLSKTGIVMTCGDGSSGCLGRGDLASSFTPCMVDGLLNMDVVGIAAGPRHVVAVCSNGQALAWGDSRHGRLGLAPERLQAGCHMRAGVYVARPQLVHFRHSAAELDHDVFIKSAFCGDRCTVFIDSNNQCWACGANSSNKLGLDRRRRFKRTVLVEAAWTPTRVAALARERVVSCSIGRHHASYLTAEGRMLVFGQDIDQTYRLQMNLRARAGAPVGGAKPQQVSHGRAPADSPPLDHEALIDSLLAHDRLGGFKSPERARPAFRWAQGAPKPNRFVTKQVELFLKRSRGSKRMPFEGVLAVSCTPKSTLILTSDNRIYFWGVRTHQTDQHGRTLSELKPYGAQARRARLPGRVPVEPQLVATCSDECFVKIGATNSSLMGTVELLGSDQPIILARNPQLTAKSLDDLWILDYAPRLARRNSDSSLSSASSWSCSLSAAPSCASLRDSCSALADLGPPDCSSRASADACPDWPARWSEPGLDHYRHDDCFADSEFDDLRHDAILEPQPIVSLYVPAMFNHSGCALQLVNLFCVDEDRFFLVLDTTVKFQQAVSFAASVPVPAGVRSRPMKRRNTQSFKSLVHARTRSLLEHDIHPATDHMARARANMMGDLVRTKPIEAAPLGGAPDDTLWAAREQSAVESAEFAATTPIQVADRSKTDPVERTNELANSRDHSYGGPVEDADFRVVVVKHPAAAAEQDRDAFDLNTHQVSPVSHNCLSLEEPRSMSTFAPGFDGNHISILNRSASRDPDCESLRRLSFEQSQQSWHFDLVAKSPQSPGARLDQTDAGMGRPHGRSRLESETKTNSESTATTGGYEDDTSSMPTWVRNEYIQQVRADHEASHLSRRSGSPSSGDEHATCVSEATLTDEASSGSSSSLPSQWRLEAPAALANEDGHQTTEVEWLEPSTSLPSTTSCDFEPAPAEDTGRMRAGLHNRLSRSQPTIRLLESGRDLIETSVVPSAILEEEVSAGGDESRRGLARLSRASSESCREGAWRISEESHPNEETKGQPDPDECRETFASADWPQANPVEGVAANDEPVPVPEQAHRPEDGPLVVERKSAHPAQASTGPERHQEQERPSHDNARPGCRGRSGLALGGNLSRSAYFGGELDPQEWTSVADWHPNGRLRRHSDATRSRSSLTSIRKSLVRIFC